MVKEKKCRNPKCDKSFRPRYSTLEKYCSSACATACIKPNKNKPYKRIKRLSGKRKIEEAKYQKKRIEYLSDPGNKFCRIRGTNCTSIATTVEHRMGRRGYASEEKRQNGVSLLVDEDFFLPACNNCNLELENNPELSKKHQLSKIHGGKKI